MTLEELHAHQDQVDQKLLRLVSQVVSHVPGGRETFCTHLGTVGATKTDEFSEKFQKGVGLIFNPKFILKNLDL